MTTKKTLIEYRYTHAEFIEKMGFNEGDKLDFIFDNRDTVLLRIEPKQ